MAGFSHDGRVGEAHGETTHHARGSHTAAGTLTTMKHTRRLAWVTLIVALLVILGMGFFRASMHEEPRPDEGPAASASAAHTP